MKFFIDTANLEQIKEAQALGVLDGVTTNPSLMAKEGITGADNILEHYLKIWRRVRRSNSNRLSGYDWAGRRVGGPTPPDCGKITHDNVWGKGL